MLYIVDITQNDVTIMYFLDEDTYDNLLRMKSAHDFRISIVTAIPVVAA